MLESDRNLAGGFVDIAPPVRFVDHDKLPWDLTQVRFFGPSKLIGAEDHGVLLQRIQVPGTDSLVKIARLQSPAPVTCRAESRPPEDTVDWALAQPLHLNYLTDCR